MNDAKVTLSEEFKEKTKYKELTRREKGEIIRKRFESLSLDQIKQARGRKDIAKLIGYTDSNISAGVTTVARYIKLGRLKETFYGYNANGYVENTYDLPSNDPRYSKNVKITEIEKPEFDNSNLLNASIFVGESTKVTIENISVENLSNLIKSLK